MKNNYHITRSGTLKRDQNTLLLIDENDEKHRIPIKRVEAIYAHGQLDYNTRLADFLNKNGVEVHMFGWNGQYAGSLVPKRGQVSGKTIVNQVSAYKHPAKRIKIAREFVRASSENMKRSLKYYTRNGTHQYDSQIQTIESVKSKIENKSEITELLGCEAEAREAYYHVFRNEIDAVQFNSRQYNPPPNRLNAVISYLNSILYANCVSGIRKTALDPTISYLHEPGERRYSLALDIADLFKPLLVTRVITRLFNRNQLKKENFREEVNSVLLDEEGREICAREFETQLDTTIEHKSLNRHVSYQYLLQLEAYNLKKHLLTGEPYTAFEKWW